MPTQPASPPSTQTVSAGSCACVACLQELRAKLLAEAEQSARQNAAVAMRWADLFSIEVPQDLYYEIEKQRQACEKVIGYKDKLISGTLTRPPAAYPDST